MPTARCTAIASPMAPGVSGGPTNASTAKGWPWRVAATSLAQASNGDLDWRRRSPVQAKVKGVLEAALWCNNTSKLPVSDRRAPLHGVVFEILVGASRVGPVLLQSARGDA